MSRPAHHRYPSPLRCLLPGDRVAALAIALGLGCGPENVREVGAGVPISEPERAPDNAPVVHAKTPPPPISGGTLLVTDSGDYAVASDPDRARIFVVDLRSEKLLHAIALPAADEPGRLAEDTKGLVHVAMRGSGDVVTLDPESGELIERRHACPNPRGIMHDADLDALWIACAGGTIVQLPVTGTEGTTRWVIDADLRDVLPELGSELPLVTQFRRAAVLGLQEDGSAMVYTTPRSIQTPQTTLRPLVAWRTRPRPDGGWIMVHQLATLDPIDLGTEVDDEPAYGGVGSGTDGCNPNVGVAVTLQLPSGASLVSSRIAGAVLPVDVAVDPVGTIAVALAGTTEETPNLRVLSADDLHDGESPPCRDGTGYDLPGQPVAVDFGPDLHLVVQSREPAALFVFDPGVADMTQIALSSESARDTGHDLFHLDTGESLACASCHPEGGEDGFTWAFEPIGARRSQPLYVGLQGTEPFHWEGDMADLTALFEEVHGHRMGGRPQSAERIAAVRDWLDTLKPPVPLRPQDDEGVARGRAAFEDVGCAKCHGGPMLTNADSVASGAEFNVQVPTLRAVALRGPYMHDGRAATLRDAVLDMLRLSAHGGTATEAEIDDIVTYLESL